MLDEILVFSAVAGLICWAVFVDWFFEHSSIAIQPSQNLFCALCGTTPTENCLNHHSGYIVTKENKIDVDTKNNGNL